MSHRIPTAIALLFLVILLGSAGVTAITLTTNSVSEDSVTLKWTRTSLFAGDFVEYRIWRGTGAEPSDWDIIRVETNIEQLTYKDEGLKPDTTYAYRIEVHNRNGDVVEHATTSDRTPKPAPKWPLGVRPSGWAIIIGLLIIFLPFVGLAVGAVEIALGRIVIRGGLGGVLFLLGIILMAVGL